MNKYQKIGSWGFYAIATVFLLVGIRYLLAGKVMPFHLAAMEQKWAAFSSGQQLMLLNFMKAAGLGFFTTGTALFLLLRIWKKGNPFAGTALFSITQLFLTGMNILVFMVKTGTAGNPPFIPFLALWTLSPIFYLLIREKRGTAK